MGIKELLAHVGITLTPHQLALLEGAPYSNHHLSRKGHLMSSSFSKHVVPPAYSSDSKSSEVRDYVRKSFPVKAIQLTDKNVEVVAAFCHGEIGWMGKDAPIVIIPANKKDAKPAEARVGDYVICIPRAGRNKQDVFAVYNKHAFGRAFDVKPTDEELADAVVKVEYAAETGVPLKNTQNQDDVALPFEKGPGGMQLESMASVWSQSEKDFPEHKHPETIRFNPGDEATKYAMAHLFWPAVAEPAIDENTKLPVVKVYVHENELNEGVHNAKLRGVTPSMTEMVAALQHMVDEATQFLRVLAKNDGENDNPEGRPVTKEESQIRIEK